MLSQRSVLVVGGAGYIGSVLVRQLLETGHRVTVLDALLYGNGGSLAGVLEDPGFRFVLGDYTDPMALQAALPGTTDVVLLAALVGDPICKTYPDRAREVNQTGAIALVDLLDLHGVERFVFASTCSNYGLRDAGDLATEESALNPVSLYAQTKVAVEQHILAMRTKLRVAPTVLRLSTAHGLSPRMRFDLTVAEFTRDLALGRDLLVYDEDTWRPYCHVRDISAAIRAVLGAPLETVRGEVFNVGATEENFTKRDLVELIAQEAGGAGTVTYKTGGKDPRNYRVSFEKAARVLGFQVTHGVRRSVPEVVRAVRAGCFDDAEQRRTFYGNYVIA